MKKKGNLFFLIKSLTKSEKRYFRLQAADSGKNYLRLFDFIDRQSKYDEQAVKTHFAGEAFVKQLHVTKIYLSDLIMRSLRNYHAEATRASELKELLRDVEILHHRELLDLCEATIAKAIRIARKFERHYELLELLAWQRRLLLQRQGQQDSKKAINDILDEERATLEKAVALNEYWRLTVNLFDSFVARRQGELETDDGILEHPLMRRIECADSLQARILYHHILYAHATVTDNLAAADNNISQLIAFLEGRPEMVREDPTSYMTALNNKIGMCLQLRRHSEVPELLAKVKAIPEEHNIKKQRPVMLKLLLRTYNLELELYRDSRDLERGIALSHEIHSLLKAQNKLVPHDYRLLFHYQFAYLFFLQMDYHQCLNWLNEILRTNYGSVREDIQSFAQLLNLMVHFELGNTTVLRYGVDSCRRFLKKKRTLLDFEKVLLRFFSKVCTVPVGEHDKLFTKLQQELFLNTTASEKHSALDYLDFESWISGKLTQA